MQAIAGASTPPEVVDRMTLEDNDAQRANGPDESESEYRKDCDSDVPGWKDPPVEEEN